MSINTNDTITMTYSAVVTKDKKKAVCVRFERNADQGVEFAEGILPECDIVKQKGFSQEEIEQLQDYLKENRAEILQQAKGLSNFMNWFK